MKSFIQFDHADATCLKIRIQDEMLARIDNALTGRALRLRTRESFCIAAVSWALRNLDADHELTATELQDEDES